MADSPVLTIGTRGSALALAQTNEVVSLIQGTHPGIRLDVRVIRTAGDRNRTAPLSVIGGKGVFAKELEAALADGTIDLAVHSLKDLPPRLEPGLLLAAVPTRADPRDALITQHRSALADLPSGATVGTSSARRRALVLAIRPDLTVVNIRGNVDTRAAKALRGEVDAVVLAVAGLERLGRLDTASEIFSTDLMTPAPGQGALGIEVREGNSSALALAHAVDDADAHVCADAERGFLARLGAGCSLPVGAFARLEDDTIQLQGFLVPEGAGAIVRSRVAGPRSEALSLGQRLASLLIAEGGSQWPSSEG